MAHFHSRTARLALDKCTGLIIAALLAAFIWIVMAACPAAAGPPIGINIAPLSDYSGENLFADAMKESRNWTDTNGVNLTNLDSSGWPQQDAQIVVFAGNPDDMSGNYTLSFNGLATISVLNTGTTITPSATGTYNSSTNTTTATINVSSTSPGINFLLKLTNTQRTSGSGTNTGVTNVQLMRPIGPGGTSSYATTTLFTNQALTLFSNFQVLRFMDYLGTNTNPQVNWTDRTKPGYATQQTRPGGAWEYIAALGNATNCDVWINIPIQATDDYVTKVAQTLFYGSDGVNPYTSTQANPVFAPLNSSRRVYVEYGNEEWNVGSNFDGPLQIQLAKSEGAPLNFDGETNGNFLAMRRVAQREMNISNIFRGVWGSSNMMTRVRPVLESQLGSGADATAGEELHMMEDYYNNSLYVANPLPPTYYFYGGGGSAYYSPDNQDQSMVLDDNNIWTSWSFSTPDFVAKSLPPDVNYELPNLGRRIAYEGGPGMDVCQCGANPVKRYAWAASPQMSDLILQHQVGWNQTGGDLLVYYQSTAYNNYYQWAFVDNIDVQNTPKMIGIQEINTSTQAVSTYGAPIPATLTASAYNSPVNWLTTGPGALGSNVNQTWLGYVVSNSSAGSFNIALNAGSVGSSNAADIYVDGAFAGTLSIANTGSNSTYANTATVATASLPAGSHGIMVKVHTGVFGFNQVIVTAGSGGGVPQVPGSLTASAGNTQVTLSWNASGGATTYNVYRGLTSGGEGATALATGIASTTYTNTGLTNGTTYYYKVTAVNSVGESGQSSEASATPAGVPTTSGPASVNAGGPAATPFVADADFSGGTTATNWTGTIDTSAVSNPAPQAVYQSERYGNSTYTFPGLAPSTSYTVRLHFCENFNSGAGQRVFNVSINGTQVLTNFDIYATTGAQHKANIQQSVATSDGGGNIAIVLTGVTGNALVNGIEVLATAPPPTGLSAIGGNAQVSLTWSSSTGATSYNVYRGTTAGGEGATAIATGIASTSYTNTGLANGTAYYYKVTAVNSAGESAKSGEASATPSGTNGIASVNAGGPAASPFVADTDFSGGTTATNWTGAIDTTAASFPAPQAVYQSERYGDSVYTFPGLTANGAYTVRLHFCENYNTGAGQRVFNVGINGNQVLTNFDIYAATNAQHKANIQQFAATADAGGNLAIAFTSVNGNALINGIEILSTPLPPTSLAATGGNAQVALTWAGSAGASSYSVYRGTTAGGEGATAIATGIASTSYTNTGLTNGATYFYKVTAVNGGGESGKSNEASAATAGTNGIASVNAGGPAASPFVADTDFSGGLTATNWTGAIDVSAVSFPAPQAVYQSERYGNSTYTFPGLAANGAYTARLHFCENYNSGAGQRVFNVGINGSQVLTNYDIYATTGAQHKANIKQFAVTADSGGNIAVVLTSVTGSALINGIEILSTPSAPTSLAATGGNAQVALTWTGSLGAATYSVYRGTTAGGESGTALATGIATTTYTDTSAANGSTYYYTVKAVNTSGTSGASNEANAKTYLFFDNFESDALGGAAAGWTVASGTWSVTQPSGQTHEYTTTGTSGIVTAGSTWTNYSVQSQVNISSTAGEADVLGRVVDSSNLYQLTIKNGTTWGLYKKVAGAFTTLASGTYSFSVNTNYVIKLDMNGSTITGYASSNGGSTWTTLGSATDTTYTSGKIGLKAAGSSSITGYFDNVTAISH